MRRRDLRSTLILTLIQASNGLLSKKPDAGRVRIARFSQGENFALHLDSEQIGDTGLEPMTSCL